MKKKKKIEINWIRQTNSKNNTETFDQFTNLAKDN